MDSIFNFKNKKYIFDVHLEKFGWVTYKEHSPIHDTKMYYLSRTRELCLHKSVWHEKVLLL